MKVYLTSILLALSLTTYAQVRDISVLAGVNVPMYNGVLHRYYAGLCLLAIQQPVKGDIRQFIAVSGRVLDRKVMPAFHYNLTANYIYNKSTVEEGIVVREYTRPLHWFFSLCGGIAYRIE